MAQTSWLESMTRHEYLGASMGSCWAMPRLIHSLSALFGQECWSGWSRAIQYHTAPAPSPSSAHTQKETRQPRCTMMERMMGGVKAEPAPTPAKIRPLAKPRSAVGIQLATQRFELGYMTDSPMPRKNRTDQMIRKACAMP